MDQPKNVLADRPDFGRVYDCECGSIHVQVGPINVAFSVNGYMEFVDLINTSAANFETVLQRVRQGEDAEDETAA